MTRLTHKILYPNRNLIFLFSVLFLPIMTIGILQFSHGLIPLGLFGAFFIIIGGLLLGFVSLTIEKRTKTKVNHWLFLISLLSFLSVIAFFIIAGIQGTMTNNRAEKLITALEEYNSDNGHYPDKLELLTNNYLKRVPSTAFGVISQNFEYKKNAPNDYELYYYSYIGVEYWYTSNSKEWRVDD